ncbi:MAG: Gfo/Idh/MocA family oxidoreductase [Bacteroides sp.]|jgi:predicted dehydrogenase|nr:Gfo/Idh/MocA family oxidoreductase [Bacteroides sp.]
MTTQVNKIGVLGAGHLGKIHIKCIQESERFDLLGFYDPNPEICSEVEEKFGIKRFPSADALIDACQMVDIVTPTVNHFESASRALRRSRHVFIEKPLTTTLTEARELIELAREANVKVQVGHVERFNPAFIAAYPYLENPMFIETHRLAPFNPRGTDVPVILDLMIHDIDIVLHVIKSPIKKVSASGVAVVSDTPDIANARVEFNNGCVANLTASRISMKNMRKSRFFQKEGYISVDFLTKETEIIRMQSFEKTDDPFAMVIDLGPGKGKKQIFVEKPKILPINAIKTELETFHASIVENTLPVVTIEDGYRSLELAYLIMEKIEINTQVLG